MWVKRKIVRQKRDELYPELFKFHLTYIYHFLCTLDVGNCLMLVMILVWNNICYKTKQKKLHKKTKLSERFSKAFLNLVITTRWLITLYDNKTKHPHNFFYRNETIPPKMLTSLKLGFSNRIHSQQRSSLLAELNTVRQPKYLQRVNHGHVSLWLGQVFFHLFLLPACFLWTINSTRVWKREMKRQRLRKDNETEWT